MKKIILFSLIFSFLFFSASIALAATQTNPEPAGNAPADAVKLTNPLTGNTSSETIPVYLGKVINYAMGIIGSLALVMFIYGGALWMLSAGNQEQVQKGKQVLIWAALGLAIIFIAYALVRFVIMAISGAA